MWDIVNAGYELIHCLSASLLRPSEKLKAVQIEEDKALFVRPLGHGKCLRLLSPAESPMRALHPQSAKLNDGTLLPAQLQSEALPCAHVQKGGCLPVIGSGKYTEHHPLSRNLEDTVQGA